MSDPHELTPGLGGARTTMVSLPDGLGEIIDFYGDPDADGDLRPDEKWETENVVSKRLPYPMALSWNPERWVHWTPVHRKCAGAMMGALEAFRDAAGLQAINANGWDRFGGIYNLRLMTGSSSRLSTHSWGMAIDVNPHLGAYGEPSTQPPELIDAFAEAGAEWGGDWPSMNPAWPSDAQHFQFATGY